MKIPDDLAHLSKRTAHFSPLFNPHRHVVLSRDLGRVPSEVTCDPIDGKDVLGRTDFVGIDVRWDELPPKSPAWHQAVGQQVAIGVVGRWVVDPRLVQTRVFCGGVQQLDAVVVAGLGIDDEQRLDGKRGVHRPRHVQDPFVPVGVLHGQGVDARSTVRVGSPVDVFLDVSGHHGHWKLSGQTVQPIPNLIAPRNEQPRAVRESTGFGVGRDDHLVRQTLNVGVRDFPGAVVRGHHVMNASPTEQQQPCQTQNGPFEAERKDDLEHGKTKLLVATFDPTS